MELDGVGGVSILAKARVFRAGVHFPAFSFEKHAETEGFGKMAKRMGFSVVGLPHYTVWHLYEPSIDDIRHMEEMEMERAAREAEEYLRREEERREKEEFGDVKATWARDKLAIAEEKTAEIQKERTETKEPTRGNARATEGADERLVVDEEKKTVPTEMSRETKTL